MTKPTAKSAAANERRNLKLLFLTRQIVEIVKIIIKLNHRVKLDKNETGKFFFNLFNLNYTVKNR